MPSNNSKEREYIETASLLSAAAYFPKCGLVQYEDRYETLWIAFRGTDASNPVDVAVDANFAQSALGPPFRTSEDPQLGGCQLHSGFLSRFRESLDVCPEVWLDKSDGKLESAGRTAANTLKDQLQSVLQLGKRIIFTGHSLGGAVADVATLWLLLECSPGQPLDTIFCATFGAPLIGNQEVADLVKGKNWTERFLHVKSRNDIVPRSLNIASRLSRFIALPAMLLFFPIGVCLRPATYFGLLRGVFQHDQYKGFGIDLNLSMTGGYMTGASDDTDRLLALTSKPQPGKPLITAVRDHFMPVYDALLAARSNNPNNPAAEAIGDAKSLAEAAMLSTVAKIFAGLQASPRKFCDQDVADDPRVREVAGKLLSSDTKPLGVALSGMGGLGKTTLADHTCGYLRNLPGQRFNDRIFFASVHREESGTATIDSLKEAQKQLLQQMTGAKTQSVGDVGDGQAQLMTELNRLKSLGPVLLVVDNLPDDDCQGNHLLPKDLHTALAAGSRVLVTTRTFPNAHLINLNQQELPFQQIRLEPLSEKESLELLLKLIEDDNLRKAQPSNQYQSMALEVVKEVARLCSGLPLALKTAAASMKAIRQQVLGSTDPPNAKLVTRWQGFVADITSKGNFGAGGITNSVASVLNASIDALEPACRQLFCDICFMFTRMPMDDLECLSSDEDGAPLDELKRQSLVCVDGEGRVVVHDVLLEFTRRRIKDSHRVYGNKTWQQVLSTLDGSENLQAVEIHRLEAEESQEPASEQLFRQLRILHASRSDLAAEAAIESAVSKSPLQLLKITGSVGESLIITPAAHGATLRKLEVSQCRALQQLPLTGLTRLLGLSLTGCRSLTDLPDTLGSLAKLQHIHIANCDSLTALPKSLGRLSNLLRINIVSCKSLAALPESLGSCSQLERLSVSGCNKLAVLPESLGKLLELQQLSVTECEGLLALPGSLGDLGSLLQLNLSGCRKLDALPPTLGGLSKLQLLNVSWCPSLTSLPEFLGGLQALNQLDLSWCKKLASLPESLGNLAKLERLDLDCCKSLLSLPDTLGNLGKLQVLKISECEKLEALPESLGGLSLLQQLKLSRCNNLAALPASLGGLIRLKHMDLDRCKSLAALPESLGKLGDLQDLHMFLCTSLAALPESLGNMSHLQTLDLSSCESLASLPDSIGNLGNLKQLNLAGCARLTALPESMRRLARLEKLDLGSCTGLTNLPESLAQLPSLKDLNVTKCTGFKTPPAFERFLKVDNVPNPVDPQL